MEALAEVAKNHLECYQAHLQGRSFLIKTPPEISKAKWVNAAGTMKVTYDVACTYLEQLEQYVQDLKEVIASRKTQVGEVEKSINCVDMAIAEFKKRKEPEAIIAPESPHISVVETPVMKKPAPNVLRR